MRGFGTCPIQNISTLKEAAKNDYTIKLLTRNNKNKSARNDLCVNHENFNS